MRQKIGFSTGAFYIWYPDINKRIYLLRDLKVDAIEISFINIEELNFDISDENIYYLNSISYVSLHAPVFNSSREKISICKNKRILEKLHALYVKIKAKTIVFHPDTIEDWDLITNLDMNVSIENLPIEDNYNNNKLIKLLEEYPKLSLVLDTAHAFSCGPSILQELITLFKKRICHIHLSDHRFSDLKGKMRDHEQFLFCPDSEKFNPVKSLSCPVIIEISVKDKKYDMININKEIDSVQDFLSK